MPSEKYPIVFIRGYAMGGRDVKDAVSDPHRGFNEGSSIVRQTNDEYSPDMGGIIHHDFPGPLLRLLHEKDAYVDALSRKYVDPKNCPHPNNPNLKNEKWRQVVWIYDIYGDEFFQPAVDRPLMEGYAQRLAVFLDQVRKASNDPLNFKVNLVAHSMGGLVARCYIQNTGLFQDENWLLKSVPKVEPVLVNKLVTYGTPHRGIGFIRPLVFAEWIRDLFGPYGSNVFGEGTMRAFLSLPDGSELNTLLPARGDVQPCKTLSIVGTNQEKYDVGLGQVKNLVGADSDGLVKIENAYIHSGPRVFVDCAHSGAFGLVNSQAGYENLIRFLFGDIKYTVTMPSVKLDVNRLREGGDNLSHLLVEVGVALQGVPGLINKLTEKCKSAIVLNVDTNGDQYILNPDGNKIPPIENTTLFVGFLHSAHAANANTVEGGIDFKMEPHYKDNNGLFNIFRQTRLEGEYIVNERLHLQILTHPALQVIYYWGGGNPNWKDAPLEQSTYKIPLSDQAKQFIPNGEIWIRPESWD